MGVIIFTIMIISTTILQPHASLPQTQLEVEQEKLLTVNVELAIETKQLLERQKEWQEQEAALCRANEVQLLYWLLKTSLFCRSLWPRWRGCTGRRRGGSRRPRSSGGRGSRTARGSVKRWSHCYIHLLYDMFRRRLLLCCQTPGLGLGEGGAEDFLSSSHRLGVVKVG